MTLLSLQNAGRGILYSVGKALSGYILQADKEKCLLHLLLHPLVANPTNDLSIGNIGATVPLNEITTCHIRDGCSVGGRI